LRIRGETEESFTNEKAYFVKLGTANVTKTKVEDIEIDTIKNFATHRRATSINMV